MNLRTILGSHLYESHGQLCQELVDAGYDLNDYYDGANDWGNMARVGVMVAWARGARDYKSYLRIFSEIKQPGDEPASQRLFSRLTGVRSQAMTQTERTRLYRQRTASELKALRESVAKTWIEQHPDEAKLFIKSLK